MKRFTHWHRRRSRKTRRESVSSKDRPILRVLGDYRFDNPGRVSLEAYHQEEKGYLDTTGSVWEHGYLGRMDWDKIQVPEPLKQAMQHFIFHELEVGAPRSGFVHFHRLLAISRIVGPKFNYPLSREHALEILGALRDKRLFLEFRRFYRWATAEGIFGFDKLILRELEDLRPPRQQCRIDARDARRYLTDAEQRLLLSALDMVPAVDDPGLRDHVLVHLCWELGCRPDQARGIDERHVHLEHLAGEDYAAVDVPRIKQRTRTLDYKRRPISPQLATKILLLLTQNRTLFGASDAASPVFRTQARINIRTKHFGSRLSANTAAIVIASFIGGCLGDQCYRGAGTLRHNMAQRMADMGAPAAVLAEALDHSTLEAVAVYVRSKPDVAILKTRALGKSAVYRDVLDWLNGRTPIPRSQAEASGVVQGMVADRYIGNIGVCGLQKDKHCPYNPVYSCYGCSQFTPFIDGEHEAVAEAMAQENLRLAEIVGLEGNRVALANEYPIAAARAVQVLCREKESTRA